MNIMKKYLISSLLAVVISLFGFYSYSHAANYTCSDTDGGYDLYTKGVLDIFSPSTGRYTVDEYCVNANRERDPNGDYIEELVCLDNDPTYAYEHRLRRCPNGCNNGKCVSGFSKNKLPDVTITDIKVLPKQTMTGGYEVYPVRVYFKNIGNAVAKQVNVRTNYSPKQLYLVSDSNNNTYFEYQSDSTFAIPQVNKTELQPNETYEWWTYINPDASGYLTIDAEVDYDNQLNEENENNNYLSKQFYVDAVANNGDIRDANGQNIITPPPFTPSMPSIYCGDSSGNDGFYEACIGNKITHYPSGAEATLIDFNSNYAQFVLGKTSSFMIDVYKNQPVTITSNNGTPVTYSYNLEQQNGVTVAITSSPIPIHNTSLHTVNGQFLFENGSPAGNLLVEIFEGDNHQPIDATISDHNGNFSFYNKDLTGHSSFYVVIHGYRFNYSSPSLNLNDTEHYIYADDLPFYVE